MGYLCHVGASQIYIYISTLRNQSTGTYSCIENEVKIALLHFSTSVKLASTPGINVRVFGMLSAWWFGVRCVKDISLGYKQRYNSAMV